ncbi:GNAT family N-acetyltransferase [Salinigranum rubrum]|uniref:GNAT family N-acetyltransferase n=1 Tax=Salinigranum rubrum TaxID=755307 RepID=A0A2I8VKB4_9EURY|nr:GNAT family N-acetyltransferase [Salinigranum rubrum]AUV82373.1 GNAT family N-acetyltransferase [Salinigranum rubrum]
MEYAFLGWPDGEEGPRLRLDYRAFAYAGKFVTSSTGVAVVRDRTDPLALDVDEDEPPQIGDPTVVAAVAFNEDRTDPETLWLRYVTVRGDRRGEGIGPHLVAFVCERARERGYARCRIAVNNVFSYEALSKVGFAYTGRETGLAEVVLDRELRVEGEVDADTYQRGLDVFRARDCTEEERAFLATREDAGPPERVDAPEGE